MKFEFIPTSELETSRKLSEGQYFFTILTAEDAISKAGRPMVKAEFIAEKDNIKIKVFGYLVHAWQLHQLCKSIGRPEIYEKSQGDINPSELLEGRGYFYLHYGKDSDYLQIKYYIDASEKKEEVLNEPNDEIPF